MKLVGVLLLLPRAHTHNANSIKSPFRALSAAMHAEYVIAPSSLSVPRDARDSQPRAHRLQKEMRKDRSALCNSALIPKFTFSNSALDGENLPWQEVLVRGMILQSLLIEIYRGNACFHFSNSLRHNWRSFICLLKFNCIISDIVS